MQKYGLIVADNGSDMYISGTYDTRWNNDMLNPAFGNLTANDFEVIQLRIQSGASGTGESEFSRLESLDGDRRPSSDGDGELDGAGAFGRRAGQFVKRQPRGNGAKLGYRAV